MLASEMTDAVRIDAALRGQECGWKFPGFIGCALLEVGGDRNVGGLPTPFVNKRRYFGVRSTIDDLVDLARSEYLACFEAE